MSKRSIIPCLFGLSSVNRKGHKRFIFNVGNFEFIRDLWTGSRTSVTVVSRRGDVDCEIQMNDEIRRRYRTQQVTNMKKNNSTI